MLRFMFPEETLDWYTWRIASMVAATARLLLPLGCSGRQQRCEERAVSRFGRGCKLEGRSYLAEVDTKVTQRGSQNEQRKGVRNGSGPCEDARE